jgi:hypothetical protein
MASDASPQFVGVDCRIKGTSTGDFNVTELNFLG